MRDLPPTNYPSAKGFEWGLKPSPSADLNASEPSVLHGFLVKACLVFSRASFMEECPELVLLTFVQTAWSVLSGPEAPVLSSGFSKDTRQEAGHTSAGEGRKERGSGIFGGASTFCLPKR